VAAATRFQDRGLVMESASPGVTTAYTLNFSYMSPPAVGSVDMLFCIDPIPYNPCVTPAGLNVAGAVLSNQAGETGFSILSKSANHIVLTRPPSPILSGTSSYRFDNIVNPTTTEQAFSIRLRSHATTDATGPQIDFGSVRGQVTTDIRIETQVPPMLIFCVAGEVEDDCADTSDINYSDMGQLSAVSTLQAQSQMAVGTNASGGFAITANGDPLSAGTNVIDAPSVPTASTPGTNQFGINLVANNAPSVGNDPEGTWQNAVPMPDYGVPNQFKYVPGDVVAYSPDVSLMKKFTVSYIVNSREDLRAGVYTTTITYIASGRF
ncbi:MAG: hypothetical protein ABWX90_03615, partial [Candidatus Saccharimonadales bacterium]